MAVFSQLRSLALAGLLFLGSVQATGINCEGSSNCDVQGKTALSELTTMFEAAIQNETLASITYSSGEQIGCVPVSLGAICAFYQAGASGNIRNALGYIEQLSNHGCKTCGSVPTKPGNDVSQGMLTVNYVSSEQGNSGDPKEGIDDPGEPFEVFDNDGNDDANDFEGEGDDDPDGGDGDVDGDGFKRLRRSAKFAAMLGPRRLLLLPEGLAEASSFPVAASSSSRWKVIVVEEESSEIRLQDREGWSPDFRRSNE
ncbi:hypothetical protein VTN77DRAFT_6749 [Rasamsonia byssochlamydoides]|uniref:uncharacterized protein n=1 Tax=Rasamsonia byssochlamydoides TaxID=89139 RepID=UPI003742D435